MGLANTTYYWEVADSGHCSSGTIRPERFREVGRRARGALCQYPAPFSFSPPQYTSAHCQLWWSGWDAGLGDKNSFPVSSVVCRPSCRQSQPGSLLLAVGWLTPWSEVMSLVSHVPTCSSLGEQPSRCLSVALSNAISILNIIRVSLSNKHILRIQWSGLLFIYLFIYLLTSLLEYNCFTMVC